MNTKLTLSIEQEIIEKAKMYAKSNNRSLSDLIESYLRSLTTPVSSHEDTLPSNISALQGAFTAEPNLDYKAALRERTEKKYL
ncbi:DUF6364 family protein [Sediminicola luteus]|jgi:hypothetical protein|uniref:Antitoxin n=1 Tax=Sediminicola luteus TaxID=319238 RepID=A0A2A4G7B8_9FLAO|nr:DUF6364 family protein [Sediminicola luteus]PCE63870.1 hypothetical protein B7P33_11440 [Sediminicola luteus]